MLVPTFKHDNKAVDKGIQLGAYQLFREIIREADVFLHDSILLRVALMAKLFHSN
jgi:hypothetical protein